MSTGPTAVPPNTPALQPGTIVIRQSDGGGWLWRIFAFLGWAGFGLAAIFAIGQFVAFMDYFDNSHDITEKYHSGEKFATNKIAIISVEGVIMSGDGFVKNQIDSVREDDEVKAVVVRVDSPGGTVTGSDYIWHHLKKLREDRKLPMVVSMGSIAASGGYYVSMAVGDQEKCIYAEPTTTTGSIGVMMPHYDISGLLTKFDVKDDSLVTHPRKAMGAMTHPMSDDHRSLLQGYINESFTRFKEVIQSGRPKFKQNPIALDALATGEIFSATKAKQNGLVDEIGFLEDAIDRAVELAAISPSEVRVIHYRRPISLFDVGGFASAQTRATELDALWELSATRAYYMASTLPPLMSTYVRLLDK